MIHRISRSRYCDYDYEQWVKYFQENAGRRLQIDFSEEAGLSPEEKQLIFPSMTAFQRGEQSEGTSLQRAAQRLGLRVPEDFGVLSFDDTAVTSLAEPDITSIEVDTFELGVQAAEILIDQIENPETSIRQTLLSTKIIARASTERA